MNFDAAFDKLLGHEGGYVCYKDDPGGETCWGISKRQYPGEDIKHLSKDRAKTIYRRDYWGPAGCDAVPDAVRFDLFDTAVNSGVKTAIKMLQRSAGLPPEAQDGVLGVRSIMAIQGVDPFRLLCRFNGNRLDYLNDLPTWPSFGRGWAQRIAENLKSA